MKTINIGDFINYFPSNCNVSVKALVLWINEDGSLKVLDQIDPVIQLWNAGYEVSSTVYIHQLV